MKKNLIAAVSVNNVIGREGKTPWHSLEELTHFKNTTSGFPVLMGRKTFESVGRPLDGRMNIIVSRNRNYNPVLEKIIVFSSLQDAFKYCEAQNFEKIYIIGGGEIFSETINYCDEIILSRMNFETDGDVFFPEIKSEMWKEISHKVFTDFTVHYYIRK